MLASLRKRSNEQWSLIEIEYLKRNLRFTDKQIAKKLGRTNQAVGMMRRRLTPEGNAGIHTGAAG